MGTLAREGRSGVSIGLECAARDEEGRQMDNDEDANILSGGSKRARRV